MKIGEVTRELRDKCAEAFVGLQDEESLSVLAEMGVSSADDIDALDSYALVNLGELLLLENDRLVLQLKQLLDYVSHKKA